MSEGFVFMDPREYLPLSLDEREAKVFVMCPRAADLRMKLLKIGGERVIWHVRDEHVGALVDEGRTFEAPVKQVEGVGRECHKNAAWLFFRGEADPVSGYALSEDGKWRQHSWGWDGTNVLETTTSRTSYYGLMPKPFPFALSQIPLREVEAFLASTSQKNRDRLRKLVE
jgi:hypothetical protein